MSKLNKPRTSGAQAAAALEAKGEMGRCHSLLLCQLGGHVKRGRMKPVMNVNVALLPLSAWTRFNDVILWFLFVILISQLQLAIKLTKESSFHEILNTHKNMIDRV